MIPVYHAPILKLAEYLSWASLILIASVLKTLAQALRSANK